MGWFDEQIKLRKRKDNEALQESFEHVASAVYSKDFISGDKHLYYSKSAIERIIKCYGYKPKEIPSEVKDFTQQVEFYCRPLGIMRRRVKLTKGWYKDAYGPMLGFLKEDGKAVALIPNFYNGYDYYLDGKDIPINSTNDFLFDEDALCFYKPFPLGKLSPLDLVKYAFETRTLKDYASMFVMMSITTAMGLLTPKISYFVMSNVVQEKSIALLISTLIFEFFAIISARLFQIANSIVNKRVNSKMSLDVQAATMMRVLSLPPSFFRQYSSGDLSSRISYVNSLTSTIMNSILSTGLTSLFSLTYVYSIFEFAPTLVIPALIVIVATVVSSLVSTFVMTKLTMQRMELSSKESGMTYSIITGIQKIKLAGAEKRIFARWAKLYAKKTRFDDPPVLVSLNGTIISLVGSVVMYYVAAKSNIDVAGYYAFQSAYGMVSGAFMTLAGIVTTVADIKPTLEMAKPILEAEPEVTEGKQIVSKINGAIEMDNVSFRYDENMPLVIDDMSIKIKPGQYIAIVGKTGCGKSTIIRLLLGFEKPLKGSIYYDGKDINSLDLRSLRKKIGCVMQSGKLFQGDIYSNIAINAPGLTLEDAWKSAEIAGIADDIRRMPMGMHTLISEGGGGISGGQKQRLMIARAIAAKPKILIFDEATSALDNITQKKISESLDSLNCTRIVIAHRLSTIKHCDRIVYLENGKFIEDGTYDELIALNGKFAELVDRQRLDKE